MADDDREPKPLFDPRIFTPNELLAEDMEHNVDVTGDTNVEVNHTLDLSGLWSRIETGAIAFFLLVAVLGLATDFGVSVQVSISMALVLVGNLLTRPFR